MRVKTITNKEGNEEIKRRERGNSKQCACNNDMTLSCVCDVFVSVCVCVCVDIIII